MLRKFFFSKTVFFSKGVTLLYEKKNMVFLKSFVNKCESGSFDISLYPKKKIISFPSGYKLYYPSVNDFINLIKNSNKYFFYRNKKKIGKKLYFEVVFGEKNLAKKINTDLISISKNRKFNIYKNFLSLNKKFQRLNSCDLKY